MTVMEARPGGGATGKRFWLAAVVTALVMSAFVMPARGASASYGAARALAPFSGTAEVSYSRLPWYYLPPSATVYAGDQQMLVHFAVRDVTHFRLDIQTVAPAIDSGVRTIVVRGTSILAYDTRSETAGISTYPTQYFASLPVAQRPSLLRVLLAGGSFAPGGPYPASVGSTTGYLRQLRQELENRYPPEYPASYAHVVGHEILLGHPVDVVEYGPLLETDTVTGCSFARPGHCVHHYQRTGSERLWIDGQHHFVLETQQQGPADPHDFAFFAANSRFRVTGITYGVGPSTADLNFVPPVPVHRTKGNWSVLSSGEELSGSGPGSLPSKVLRRGFVNIPQPGSSKLQVEEGTDERETGPIRRITAVDVLYSDGQHTTVYAHPGDRYGFGLYVKGSYLFAQERLQVHGLPTALQIGTPRQAGSCTVWSGTYPSRERWVAFARGRVSTLIVSNAMSRRKLIAYVARRVCA